MFVVSWSQEWEIEIKFHLTIYKLIKRSRPVKVVGATGDAWEIWNMWFSWCWSSASHCKSRRLNVWVRRKHLSFRQDHIHDLHRKRGNCIICYTECFPAVKCAKYNKHWTQQYPTTEYCHSLIIRNWKTFFSSLIQNLIYKLIVQTLIPKTSKFV